MTGPRTLVQRADMETLLMAYASRWHLPWAYRSNDRGSYGSVPCPHCGVPDDGRGAWLQVRGEFDIHCHRCKLEITRCRLEREVIESPRCVAALLDLMAANHE